MSKPPVTREAIFAAADEIAADGTRPTLDAVRQRVGGSFTTLGPALRDWQALREEEARAKATPASALPDPLLARLQELGSQLWTAAEQQAHARLQADRDRLHTEQRQLADASRSLEETADRLAQQVDQLRSRCTDLEAESAQLRANLETARLEADQARERATAEQLVANELREQLHATRHSLCADLADRVQSLERIHLHDDPQPTATTSE